MKTLPLARMIVPALILLASTFGAPTAGAQAASAAPTICKDGTTSSATGRGACSGHGGVQKGGAPSTPAATPPPSSVASGGSATKAVAPTTTASKSAASNSKPAAGNTDPAGASAKCKDGTYSKSKHHSGTCSKHGGVDQWLDGSK